MVVALVVEAAIAGAVFGLSRALWTLAGGCLLFALITWPQWRPDVVLVVALAMGTAAWAGARLADGYVLRRR
jgi:hypothetical protein